MVSAPYLRGRPSPSPDPTPGLVRREGGGVDAAPGCRIGDRVHTIACSSHAGTPAPRPTGQGGKPAAARWRNSWGGVPRKGSPGIPFARLKGSPPWLPLFEPGGGYCLAGTGSAVDGRASGESDSAGGGGGGGKRARGCSRVRARAADAFLGAGDASWRGPTHSHTELAAACADTWLNATPRLERCAFSKVRTPPCCGWWGEKSPRAL